MSNPAEQLSPNPADEQPIAIELSASQVDKVIRAASQSTGAASLFTRLHKSSTVEFAMVAREDPGLSRSLLTGLAVLGLFPHDGSELSNADVARALNIGASTAHRYLATLLAAGLVRRDPNTRRYSAPR